MFCQTRSTIYFDILHVPNLYFICSFLLRCSWEIKTKERKGSFKKNAGFMSCGPACDTVRRDLRRATLLMRKKVVLWKQLVNIMPLSNRIPGNNESFKKNHYIIWGNGLFFFFFLFVTFYCENVRKHKSTGNADRYILVSSRRRKTFMRQQSDPEVWLLTIYTTHRTGNRWSLKFFLKTVLWECCENALTFFQIERVCNTTPTLVPNLVGQRKGQRVSKVKDCG